MGGLTPIVRSTLYGTAVVLQGGFDADATGEAMATHGVTGISLVPTMLRRLLDADWEPPESLRFVLLGGAPASADLLADARAADVPVYPTYGTTETASQIATATPEDVRTDPETVGSPLVTAEITIVDPDTGSPVERGEVGEIVVDGPIVTPGYLEAADDPFGERGFHTGDLGRRDEAGRLYIRGRLDDAIQTGGETVHPDRVTSELRGVADVADAAVVGIPDPEWGERVGALVVPRDGADLQIPAVESRLRDRLPPYAVPKTIELAQELPRTDSGTVDRDAVRELLRD
jgi:O-succinylbenzoic acid--CoA ligase